MESVKQQYVYFLRLKPEFKDMSIWTERENGIVSRHFTKLQNLLQEGKLILAGRTLTMEPDGCGIVILEVESEAEAHELMESDPAIAEELMTATLYPYRVALMASR